MMTLKLFSLGFLAHCCLLQITNAFTRPLIKKNAGPRFQEPLQMVLDYETYDVPSDYDPDAVLPEERQVAVDRDEDDESIREDLKKEILLLASITNRGEYASADERDIAIDLVTQLEALNPTADPASNCEGEWDLCLASTQFYRTSPFFQSIRSALNDKALNENFMSLHDRATTAGRVGRVRQKITSDELISEVDLSVGFLPGLPLRVKGTVVTTAARKVTSPETGETTIKNTSVIGKNMGSMKFDVPVGDIFSTVMQGNVPTVIFKTYYVDEGMRITRDVDDNFFVYSREQ